MNKTEDWNKKNKRSMQYDQTTLVYVRYVVNRLQEMKKKKQKQNEFQKLTQKQTRLRQVTSEYRT